jgi:hypothetical protein
VAEGTKLFGRWTPDIGDIGTHPYRLNGLIKRRGTQEHQEAVTCPIIIQHGIAHLNGTITNQIVTGVAIHEEGGGVLWGGKLKPPPEKLFFISAFTERLIVVT